VISSLLAVSISAVAGPPAPPSSLPLPIATRRDAVNLPSPNETGAPRLYFTVSGGRIWSRPIAAPNADWQPFGGTGLPPEAVGSIVELSADGRNLVALDEKQTVHYTKVDAIKWTRAWLSLPVVGPVKNLVAGERLRMPPNRGWSVSHRGPENEYYEDILGKRHPVDTGVTTLYALTDDGTRVIYADPWLPNGFDNEVSMPEGGRFVADSMDAAASTLFLMATGAQADGDAHVMYTRLYDFDTSGNNPFLGYAYRPTDDPEIRALPNEAWRRQPSIPLDGAARLSGRITILQTGKGNAARELRVEGTDATGRTGYYAKPIYASTWAFVGTDHPIDPALLSGPARPGRATGEYVTVYCPVGTLAHEAATPWADDLTVGAELLHYSDDLVGTRVVLHSAATIELELHARRGLLNFLGKREPRQELVIPDRYYAPPYSEEASIAALLDAAFGGERAVGVTVDQDGATVTIEPGLFSDGSFELRFRGCAAR
jgi:hypothetical protein